MGDKDNQEEERIYRFRLDLELSELLQLYDDHQEGLTEAFNPYITEVLRRLFQDDAFFQETPDETAGSSTHSPEDLENTRRNFKSLYEAFITAPRDQRIEALRTILESIRDTVRQRLSAGTNISPDKNTTMEQFMTAVKTMKEVVGSKLSDFKKYVKTHSQQSQCSADALGSHGSTPGSTGGFPIIPGAQFPRTGDPLIPGAQFPRTGDPLIPGAQFPRTGAPLFPGVQDQNGGSDIPGPRQEASRRSSASNVPPPSPPRPPMTREPTRRCSPVANRDVKRLLDEHEIPPDTVNPEDLSAREQEIVQNVVRTIAAAARPRSQSSSPPREPGLRRRSTSRSPLRRQSQVEEEDEEGLDKPDKSDKLE